MFGIWKRWCQLRHLWRLERELARLIAENRRLDEKLKAIYGDGPIPVTKAEMARLRELQKGIAPERIAELGGFDLDKDVVVVDDESLGQHGSSSGEG